jgi:hypothetical protein
MRNLTAKEIAERHNVEKRVAQGWIQRGYFPNAFKEPHEFLGSVWKVPESDLKGFKPPKPGRPKKIINLNFKTT